MFFSPDRVVARSRHFRFLHLSCAMLVLFVPLMLVRAQGSVDVTGTNGKHAISGRIFFPSGRSADYRPKVKLEGVNTGTLSVLADANGHFGFRGLSPGNYDIIVEGGEEYETARDSVYIDTDVRTRRMAAPSFTRAYSVTIHLQLKRSTAAGTKSGVLNAALTGVPEGARTLYLRALEAAAAGDSRKSVELLKAALYHHPNFPLALNEMGVQCLKLGQADKAADALRSALRLVPDNASTRLNYGIALLNKKEFVEAESQLRQVLQKNDASPTAHMYLGIALINLRNHAEAEREFQRALSTGGESLSQAHYYLGGIYWRKGENKRAADALETYLKLVPNASDAERIRGTIKDLRSK